MRTTQLNLFSPELAGEILTPKDLLRSPPEFPDTPGWNDERVALLKKFWADGLSASQIAFRLGEVTRNAVIGKIHRLGLAARPTPARVRAARSSQRSQLAYKDAMRGAFVGTAIARSLAAHTYPECINNKAKVILERQARKHLAHTPIAIPDLGPAPEGVIKLIDLKDCMCKWPIGDPMEDGFHFCGRPPRAGAPYCPHHAAHAYQTRKREAY